MNSVRYYVRILSSIKNSLVKLSCFDTDAHTSGKSWIVVIDKLLEMFGPSSSMKTHMLNLYQENWNSLMHTLSEDEAGKLRRPYIY